MSNELTPPASKPFYRALEDRHRGSRELIKNRLRVYLPYLTAAAAPYPDLSALSVLDAGCGRGEWLELLKEHHLPAIGVDTDADMLEACSGLGLTVHQADVLVYLQACPDHSLLALTGFHIAEHLPFSQLQDLFAQAWRVLAPGGLLILETPNPENLLVGAANFYIDPTHQRPLPAQLLSFLAEHQGFATVKLLRLQEEPRLTQTTEVNLYDVLGNVSPDYAIVAQTPHVAEHVAGSDTELEIPDTGVSLFALANRYDHNLQQQLQSLHTHAAGQQQALHAVQHRAELAIAQNQQLGLAQQEYGAVQQHLVTQHQHLSTTQQQIVAQHQQLSTTQQQIAAQHQQLSAAQQQIAAQHQQLSAAQQQIAAQHQQLSAAHHQLAAQYQQLSTAQQQLATQQAAVFASLSWRITAPLRWVSRHLGLRSGRRKP